MKKKPENELMKPDTFALDTKVSDIITEIANQYYDGNRSMALRFIVTDYQYPVSYTHLTLPTTPYV